MPGNSVKGTVLELELHRNPIKRGQVELPGGDVPADREEVGARLGEVDIDRVGLLDRRQQCSRRSADPSAFGNLRSSDATGDRRRHRRIAQAQLSSLELGTRLRSEEHTSELQSQMRISYAVFCLKKKKTIISLS